MGSSRPIPAVSGCAPPSTRLAIRSVSSNVDTASRRSSGAALGSFARLDLGENGDTLLRTTYKDAIKDGIRQGARLERRIRGGAIKRRICHVCRRQASLDDEPFPLCGGCGARRYCSVRCQRHDWVHGHDRNVPSRPVPHSSNCPCTVPADAAPEAGVSKSRRSKKKMRRGKKSRK